MRLGTASSAPYVNVRLIFKHSAAIFSCSERIHPPTINPTHGSITNYVIDARSLAPKVNAIFTTDSPPTMSIVLASYPLLYLLEPPYGTAPLKTPGGLVNSSNSPTSSDA